MTPEEHEAMELAYHEIHKLANSGARTTQSTIDACVALRQAMSPPSTKDKLRQLWKNIKERNKRSGTW